MASNAGPIAVFDSGVGGLAVLWAIQRRLPAKDLLFYADQAHFPYGVRTAAEVCSLALAAGELLAAQGAKLLVVACNTASSAALPALRRRLAIPVVGIEPAVKPACALTRRGRVGVLATDGTVQGTALDALIARVAGGVEVVCVAAPSLVDLVERGQAGSEAARQVVREAVAPLHAAGVDVVALGCTHFAFLRRAVQGAMGPDVIVLEPADAVARQVEHLLDEGGLAGSSGRVGSVTYSSSGDVERLRRLARSLRAVADEDETWGSSPARRVAGGIECR